MNPLTVLRNDRITVSLLAILVVIVGAFFVVVPLAQAQCGFEGQYEYDQGICGGGGGSASPLVLTMTASPTSIQSGQSSTLSWRWTRDDVEVSDMNSSTWSCTMDNGIGQVQNAGSRSVSPSQTSTYTINCVYETYTANGTISTDRSSSATVSVSAAKPTPPTGLSATCNAAGNQVTLRWNANVGADNGYYVRLYSGGAYDQITDHYQGTSITYPVTPGRYYDWWIHTEQSPSNYSDPAYGGFTCQAPVEYPDLIGQVGGPVNATVNQAVTLYGSVYNAGPGAAGASTGMMDVWDTNGNTYTRGTPAVGALSANGSQQISISYTPTSLTQLYYRTCADWNGNVTESNEGNNCSGWQALNVSPPANQAPTGSLDVLSCDSAGGWAYDPDVPNSAIAVHFYVDGGYAGQMSAGEYRGDLAGYGNRYHGYTWAFPSQFKNNVQHSVTAYAIDSAGGANPALGTRYVTCAPPVVTPNPPTGLNASCNAAGTEATLSWTPTPGATYYYPRAAGGVCPSGWQANGGYCIPNSNSIGGTSIAFGTTPGTSYSWWVHAGNSAGYSSQTESSFSCAAPALQPPASVSGQCDASGTTSTVSWTPVSGATYYYLRLYSPNVCPSGWVRAGWDANLCYPSGDYYTGTSVSFNSNPGQGYTMYVHSANQYGYSAANNYASYTCPVPPPPPPDLVGYVGGAVNSTVNQAVTLYGSAYNAGAGPASTFPTIFQVCDGNCATYNEAVNAGSGALGSGASQNVSASYTPTRVTQLYYRTCANMNTSWANVVTETNYANNCSGWQTFNVAAAPVPADLTPGQAPTVTATFGNAVTVSGTVYNAGGSTGSGFSNIFVTNLNSQGNAWNTVVAGSPSSPTLNQNGSASFSTTFPANTFSAPGDYYYAYCVDYNTGWVGSITESNENNNCVTGTISISSAAMPDLTSGSVSPTSATAGTPVTFWGPATNSGNATSGSFPMLFQVSQNGALFNSGYMAALAPAASAAGNANYTFSSAGTYQVRSCANYNTSWTAITTESDYNNNCGPWTTVTVAAAAVPTVSCSVSPTAIEPGQSVTYSANPGGGASGPYSWNASDGASVGSGSSVTRTLTTPGMYGMSVSAPGTSISYCPNVSVNAAWCTNASTNLSITATPTRVKSGQSASIMWSATGVNGQNASCSVSGPGVSWNSAVDASPSCSVSGSATATITTQSTYTLNCGGQTKSVTVNVIPNFTEF